MMKKVYICSPLGGNVEENLRKVRRYTKYALLCGTAPVVPHFYAICLDDSIPKEREIGIAAGLSLLWFCDEMWIFGDEITEGKSRINGESLTQIKPNLLPAGSRFGFIHAGEITNPLFVSLILSIHNRN